MKRNKMGETDWHAVIKDRRTSSVHSDLDALLVPAVLALGPRADRDRTVPRLFADEGEALAGVPQKESLSNGKADLREETGTEHF